MAEWYSVEIVRVGTAYGAFGSLTSVVTPADVAIGMSALHLIWEVEKHASGDLQSENEEVNGTDPVSRTIMIAKVTSVMPRDLEKYVSSAVS